MSPDLPNATLFCSEDAVICFATLSKALSKSFRRVVIPRVSLNASLRVLLSVVSKAAI